ncbi:MAG: ribonuclease III domain-containing protein [Eubacteriales bacterium]|nr:ribonuclease III domain-containing protein [Eubacteriales bacterium]
MSYLSPELNESDINRISTLGLAYMGDCVFEMLIRTYLISEGHTAALDLHHSAVGLVNAPAQHAFYERISCLLDAEEAEIYRRGRNAKVNSVPHNASVADYHSATGLEALFGWLFLNGRRDRVEELFQAGMREL